MMNKAGNTVEAVAAFWEIDYTCMDTRSTYNISFIHVSIYKIQTKLQSEPGQF